MVDGNEGTLYSGLSNIDMEIQDGNPAAIAVRAHFAQHSALAHVDFRIGSALGAVEEIGHEIEDCRFFGGEFAIRTAVTAAGWQSLVLDSEFVGQRSVAIETHEAGMTVIRCRFRNVPYGIRIPVVRVSHLTGESTDKLYVKDSRFEDIQGAALWVARYYDPKTQVNVDDVECARVPVFLEFNPFLGGLSRIPEGNLKIPGEAGAYAIRTLSHGLHVDVKDTKEPARKRDTVVERVKLSSMTPIPKKDFPELPPQSSWVNVVDLGAKGDGVADDTAVFRKAIAEHKAIYVPQGSYRISDTLTLGAGYRSDRAPTDGNPPGSDALDRRVHRRLPTQAGDPGAERFHADRLRHRRFDAERQPGRRRGEVDGRSRLLHGRRHHQLFAHQDGSRSCSTVFGSPMAARGPSRASGLPASRPPPASS